MITAFLIARGSADLLGLATCALSVENSEMRGLDHFSMCI